MHYRISLPHAMRASNTARSVTASGRRGRCLPDDMDGTAGNATSELSVEGLAAGYTHDALKREGREIEWWAAVNYNKYNRARTLAAVSWDLRRHATIRAYRTEGCEKELEWARGVGRFASFLSARYGVPRPLIVNLLEGEAAMFAHRLISALQLPGGYNNAIWWVQSSHRLSVFQYFMGYRQHFKLWPCGDEVNLGPRPAAVIPAVSEAERLFGKDLHLYLLALYDIHFWRERNSPGCLFSRFR